MGKALRRLRERDEEALLKRAFVNHVRANQPRGGEGDCINHEERHDDALDVTYREVKDRKELADGHDHE